MSPPPLHQAHDPRALMSRWRAVAKATGLKWRTLTRVAGFPISYLESPLPLLNQPLHYLSTGVHGDEAASAWGLLVWAESHLKELRQGAFLIFPCFNPHGLRANTRVDHRGFDINRRFHLDDDDIAGPWRQVVMKRALHLGLCLHEDYDARGCYVYELSQSQQGLSEKLLQASARFITSDPRKNIDGRKARDGIIRRRDVPADLPGMPEAIELYRLGCATTLTFETPSECAFEVRVKAQAAFVAAALRHAALP